MDDQTTRARSGFWHFILLVLLAAAFAFMATRSAEQSSKEPESEVLGFDVWCLEMQMYPAIRCDAHRNEDAQDYEKYRASVEQFEADKKARALRDQELQRRLNHDPTAPPSTGVQAR